LFSVVIAPPLRIPNPLIPAEIVPALVRVVMLESLILTSPKPPSPAEIVPDSRLLRELIVPWL
jgi:hypothetical protein